MIGTIIIAVIGYGLALFFALAGVIGCWAFAQARHYSAAEAVFARATLSGFLLAIVLALATRWLTGV